MLHDGVEYMDWADSCELDNCPENNTLHYANERGKHAQEALQDCANERGQHAEEALQDYANEQRFQAEGEVG